MQTLKAEIQRLCEAGVLKLANHALNGQIKLLLF
jgi:hypothetical protein